jgi:hypothetical protein
VKYGFAATRVSKPTGIQAKFRISKRRRGGEERCSGFFASIWG